MTHAWKRTIAGAGLAATLLVLVPTIASAHPLGNFTVNQYSQLVVRGDGVDVNYVLDMAEIPTAQVLSSLGSDESQLLTGDVADRYQHTECGALRPALTLRVDGRAVGLSLSSSHVGFPVGAAGLHTTRLTCAFRTAAAAPTAGHEVTFTNHNFDDRVGWREITAVGTSARISASDVPRASVSGQLTTYPADLLSSPLDVRAATLSVVAGTGGGAAAPAAGPTSILPRGVDQFTNSFVALVSRPTIDIAFVAVALALALVLGGLHAFAPGHGKTLMAAYLVGGRGSMRHAAMLAGSVTLTHTIGVLALGVALSISASFAPAQVYPVLGVISGLLMVGIGLTLLVRAWRARAQRIAARAEHPHHSSHLDDGAGHHHGGTYHTHAPATVERPRFRGVMAIGFVGGMVPSPSALVVLIGGIALHRTWFAVLLVVVYGLGMALALTGTGVALRQARAVMDRRLAAGHSQRRGAWWGRVSAAVPITAAAAVILVGVGLTLRGSSGL